MNEQRQQILRMATDIAVAYIMTPKWDQAKTTPDIVIDQAFEILDNEFGMFIAVQNMKNPPVRP